MFAEQMYLIK